MNLQTQDAYTEIDVNERLPEQMFNTVNSGDSFKVAYFHKNAHPSEQWSDDTSGRRLTFPTHWLEKRSGVIILEVEEFKKIIGDTITEAVLKAYDYEHSLERYLEWKTEYINQLITPF